MTAKLSPDPDDVAQARRLISKSACIPTADLTDDALKLQDLGLDSIDLVELVLEIEQQFGVEVPEQSTGDLQTVVDVGALVAGCRRGFADWPPGEQTSGC